MAKKYIIGVMGLGIAGASSAALLARAGHVVTILERATHVGPVGAGLVLQPSGQAALKRMELLDKVVACAEPLSGLDAMLANGRSLVRLRYSEIGQQTCGYGVHRGELFGVLHDAAVAAGVEICLGDAAHAMSPHLGQGANLALADAVCFADILGQSEDFRQACSRFTAQRQSTIRFYASLSRILTPFFQSDTGFLAWGRNAALPIMCALPPLRREMTRAMAGVKQGLLRSDELKADRRVS